MEETEAKEQADQIVMGYRMDQFSRLVAVTVSIVAMLMALYKVKHGNVIQDMQVAKIEELDNWGYYNSLKTNYYLHTLSIDQWNLYLLSEKIWLLPPDARARVETQLAAWKKKAQHYNTARAERKQKAQAAHLTYERLSVQNSCFDWSDSLLALGIALFAMTGLVRSRILFCAAITLSVCGVMAGVVGFVYR